MFQFFRDVVEVCTSRCFVYRSSLEGGGAGFEPMTCSGGVLRFRASRQYCTEAMSEVGCNSSPILLGKLLDFKIELKVIVVLDPIECKFSDLGTTTVILGRLARMYCTCTGRLGHEPGSDCLDLHACSTYKDFSVNFV